MTEYHTIYKGPAGETTQWEDIQRKMGNLPPKEPVFKPDKYAPEQEEVKDRHHLAGRTKDELVDMEDDFNDDRALEKYRQQRLAEIQKAVSKPRFGTVELIRGSEFVQKVTNAGEGVWVVLLLYKESNPRCELLATCLNELAAKYPHSKFLKSVSTDCIPNYPDANLPTILIYYEGQCKATTAGWQQYGGPRMTPEQVALALNTHGPICMMPDEDEDAAAHAQVRGLVERLVAAKEARTPLAKGPDDEDSDFD